ncbi:hypothetical protein J437_LFUL018874 [Ladona fulva]|nr:hypothetical protein J437_LFUL018874 [Ladona fulva]
MSTQKGNSSRSRPQKHQNTKAFKNNLYDTSTKTKLINSIQVVNVCPRCKNIIEWKIKYKKYKPLKAPKSCTKCNQKCVKSAYHTLCSKCANQQGVCPKCGKKEELIGNIVPKEELRNDPEVMKAIKQLPERKRRSVLRQLDKGADSGKSPEEDNGGMSKEAILEKIKAMSLNDDSTWDDLDEDSSENSDDNSGSESDF